MKEFWKTGPRRSRAHSARVVRLVRRAQAGAEEGRRAREGHARRGGQGQGEGGFACGPGRREHPAREGGQLLEAHGPLRGHRRHTGRRGAPDEPREARGGRAGGGAGDRLRPVRARHTDTHGHCGRRGRASTARGRVRGEVSGRQAASTRASAARRRCTWSLPGSRARSTRSRSTCATATCCTSSATTCARSRSRVPTAASRSRGRRRGSGRSRSRSPPARVAGRWTACSARSRTCAWTRSRARA